jgi:transcriptional regulator with XRE-family HTH domain
VGNVVTISDIAARCGVGEDTISRWLTQYQFPDPLIPASAGVETWWWPDIYEFIDLHCAELAEVLPVLPGARAPRPPGKRGREPVLDPFGLQQVLAMRTQLDDQGRPRYTARQIAASLPYPVDEAVIHVHAPGPGGQRRGRGGDLRALPDQQIGRLRALRAKVGPDGKAVHTLRDLAIMFGISDMTASRYCRDIQVNSRASDGRPHITRARRIQPVDAEGNPIADELVRRIQALGAERDSGGTRRYTREEVAEACGVTAAIVTRLERGLTGPSGGHADREAGS